jgi:hypothetical protein
MFLLVSIALAAGVLLATQRYGTRAVLPMSGLICLAAVVLFDAGVGLSPLMGLIAGFQVERQRSYGQIVAVAASPGAVLSLWLVLTDEPEARARLAADLAGQLEAMGMQVAEGGYGLREMVGAVLRVQPAIEFVTMLFTVVLAYRVGLWGAGRLQLVLPHDRPFPLWRLWDELIWGLVAGLALGLVGSGLVEDLALNLVLVLVVLYAVQGLALVRFFVWRLGISRLLELLFYVLLLFTSGLALIALASLGLLDTWFDWRRLRESASEQED